MLNWNFVRTTRNLLTLRTRQLQRRDENLIEIDLRLRRLKEQNKNLFDDKHQLRMNSLKIKNLILTHDIKLNNRHDLKLTFKWLKFFRIAKIIFDKNNFKLKKLNEASISKTYIDDRLNRYSNRDFFWHKKYKKKSINEIDDNKISTISINHLLSYFRHVLISSIKKLNNYAKAWLLQNEKNGLNIHLYFFRSTYKFDQSFDTCRRFKQITSRHSLFFISFFFNKI